MSRLGFNEMVLIVASLVCFSLLGIVAIANHYNSAFYAQALKEGYSQQPLPGLPGSYWVKGDK